MTKEYPDKRVYFKLIIAEENYVVLHCYQGRHGDGSGNWAGINIFRLDDKGKKEYPPSNVELALFKNIPLPMDSVYINLCSTVIAMDKNIFVLIIMATIVATGTIISSLTSYLLNPVMAQGNITKGNTTAGNTTDGENIKSTSPVRLIFCPPNDVTPHSCHH